MRIGGDGLKTHLEKCIGCGKPLREFSGFIPNKGEYCKVCYDKQLVESSDNQ